MAAPITTTTVAGVLKTLYTDKQIQKVLYEDSPLLGMMAKKAIFTGDGIKQPVIYGGHTAVSPSFANAQTQAAASSYNRYAPFTLTRSKCYALGQITREAMLAGSDDKGSFVRVLKSEMDGTLYGMKKQLGNAIYGNGGGALGRATFSSAVATLTNAADVVNFELGQYIELSDTDGTSGSVRGGSPGYAILTAISRGFTTATLTASANWSSSITSPTASDYLFALGSFGTTVKGLGAWVPTSAPSSSSFFGVDRSVDTARLGGLRYDATGLPIEEALQRAATLVFREGGKLTHFFMNPVQFNNLTTALNSRTNYVSSKSTDAVVGYEGVKIATPGGMVECYADPYCPSTQIFGLSLPTWTFYSLKELPHFIGDDGNDMLRLTSEDSFEWRMVYMGQIGCSAPGHNINITVAAS